MLTRVVAKSHNRVLAIFLVAFFLISLLAIFGKVETAKARKAEAIPASSKIDNMPVYAQQRTLSCEYAATRAALGRWDINISELDFINAIPQNPNPHFGYRGNINGVFGGTVDYGIYAEPIALYLNSHGINAKLLSGGIEELKSDISKGRPVVVWVPSGVGWGSPYLTSYEGVSFKLMAYEHAVTAYGYDEDGIYIADPGFGTYDYYSWDSFIRAWGYLDNMGMSILSGSPAYTADESYGIAPQFYRQWLLEGGLELYGYPISLPVETKGKIFQYFERARMEYDLSAPATQIIALGLLGRELTATRTDELFFRPVAPLKSDSIWYLQETGHTLGGAFLSYWLNRGGLAVFGFPISESFVESGQVVQYFERTRLELVPGTNDQITLGLLGREILNRKPNTMLTHLPIME
ncbi:C39 family peptidase [Candidatus Chlorohelix sp.]|uniref:C39 family peptidase n=1 Tax=Candidatus Chlorohelix sp. TaxID=3139201 RepID=UPI0030535753